MIGELLSGALKLGGREALEVGGTRAIATKAGEFAADKLGGQFGQKVLGQRVSSRIASDAGQRWTKRVVSHEVKGRLRGDDKPKPQAAPQPVSNLNEGDLQGGTLQRDTHAIARQVRISTAGFGGTSGGWWNLNDQVGQRQGDWRQIGDFNVNRGGFESRLPFAGAGRQLASNLSQGIRSARSGAAAGGDSAVGVQTGRPAGPYRPGAGTSPIGETGGGTSAYGAEGPLSGQGETYRRYNLTGVRTVEDTNPTAGVGSGHSGPSYAGGTSRQAAFHSDTWPALGSGPKAVGSGPRAVGPVIDTHTVSEDKKGQLRWDF